MGEIKCLEFAPATTPELAEKLERSKTRSSYTEILSVTKTWCSSSWSYFRKPMICLSDSNGMHTSPKEYLIFKQLGITGIDDLVEYDYNTEE